MTVVLEIGEWLETEAREITQPASSFAADWEKLRTVPGRYPVRLTIEGGYVHPMPYWVLVAIDAERLDGRAYSAFGGLIFGSSELPKGPAKKRLQMYAYQLRALIESGRVVLKPGFEQLAADDLAWGRAQTWESVQALVTP